MCISVVVPESRKEETKEQKTGNMELETGTANIVNGNINGQHSKGQRGIRTV